nr:efflux RND transporter permease subunit [Calditrichia bacterium]
RGRGGPGGGGPNPEEILKQRMTDYLVYKYRDDATLGLLTDQSVFIRNAIDEVKNTAVLGGVFAVIVLLLFLNNFSTTLIVAASIPVSIIATFAPMRLFDVSLNIMSLGGLALGVGMLVDNAIVVTESIFRCREDGDGFVESVIRGTSEVGGAVTASTLTTIAVFFPMIFVEGVAGQIFGDLSVTIVFSLLASLAAALFFIPMLASRKVEFGKRQENGATLMSLFTNLVSWTNLKTLWSSARQRWSRRKTFSKWSYGLLFWLITIIYALLRFAVHTAVLIIIKIYGLVLLIFSLTVGFIGLLLNKTVVPAMNFLTGKFNKGVDHLTERYTRVIRWALANRMSVIMMALLPFLVAVFILLPRLGSELIPEVRQGEFYLQLSFPIGTPVETTAELIDPIERYILDDGDVEKISTVAGVDLSKITDSESGEHTAQLTVKLNENAGSPVEVEDRVLERIRTYLADFSGLTYQVSRPVLFSFKTPIEVEIEGYNLADLSSASRQAVQALSQIPGVTDVKSNVQRGNPEVQIIYDRVRLAHFGLNVLDVANLVRNKVRGDVATEFKKEDRRIDVRVKIRDEDKETIDRLRSLNIAPQSEYPIPLEAVAKIEISEGPSEIRRIDQQRTAVIMANIVGRDLASVSDDVYAVMNNLDLPRDFRFEIAGQNKEMEVSLNSLKLALLLAIFMVYVVMASQFESFLHPLVILFTVPFALIGVVLVLFVMGIPLNIMVFLGIIMLAGIVVNNAIVLVDYINQLRREGMEKEAAIVKAGQARLRPILMTTATTVLGLLPMALGLGEGAEIRTPMAITVIAGLISATFLTLVVIPTVYAIMERKEKLEPTTMV